MFVSGAMPDDAACVRARPGAAVWMGAGWTVAGGAPAEVVLTEAERAEAAGASARLRDAGLSGAQPPVIAAIAEAVAAVAGARRPVFLAGTPCMLDRAGPDLADLGERTGIPLILRGAARGCVSDDHPGVIPGAGPAALVLAEADLVLPVEDAAHARALSAAIDPPELHDWWDRIGEMVADGAARAARGARVQSAPPTVARVGAELAQRFGARGCLVTDARLASLADQVIARAPGSVVTLEDASDTIAFAAGWRLARPDEPVLVLADPLGLERAGLDLVAAARAGAPVAVVMLDAAREGAPPLEMLAEIAGGVGDTVETPRALAIALTNATSANVPSVVRVRIAGALPS